MNPWGMEARYGFGAARIPLAPASGPRRRRMLTLREGLASRRRDGTDTSLAHAVRSAAPVFLLVLALTVLLRVLVGAPRDDSSIQIVQFAPLEAPTQPVEVARAEPPEPVQPPPPAVPEPTPPPPEAPATPEPVQETPPPTRARPPAPQIEAPVRIARAAPARPRSSRPAPKPSPAPERRPQLAIEALSRQPRAEREAHRSRRPAPRSADPAPPARPRLAPTLAAPAPVDSAQHAAPVVRARRPTRRAAGSRAAPPALAIAAPVSPAAPTPGAPRPARSRRAPTAPPPRSRRSAADVAFAAPAAPAPGSGGDRVVAPARSSAPAPVPARARSSSSDPGIAGVPLGSLAACVSDQREDGLKQQIVARAGSRLSCESPAGRYHFVQVKNVNAFLMRIERAPGRRAGDRCVELAHALDCLAR